MRKMILFPYRVLYSFKDKIGVRALHGLWHIVGNQYCEILFLISRLLVIVEGPEGVYSCIYPDICRIL